MKHSNTCPTCGSKEIFLDESSRYLNYPRTVMRESAYNRYICLSCGYIEEWAYPNNPKIKGPLKRLQLFFDYDKYLD